MFTSWLSNVRSIWVLLFEGFQELVCSLRIGSNILSALPERNCGFRLVGDVVLDATILAPRFITTLGSDTDELIKEHFASVLQEEGAVIVAKILVYALGYVVGNTTTHRIVIATAYHCAIWPFAASVIVADAARAIATWLRQVTRRRFLPVRL